MDKLDVKEKIWGGIFGAIAIIAAIAEMMANGLSASSVCGAIKDVAGTAVVVLILCAFLKGIKRPKKIAEILEKAVEEWGDKNAPLIFKAEGYGDPKPAPSHYPLYTQGYVLLQKPQTEYVKLVASNLTKDSDTWHKYAISDKTNRSTGKFIDMPDYDKMTQEKFAVLITMNQRHFDKIPAVDDLIGQIAIAANSPHDERIEVSIVGEKKTRTILLTCKPIIFEDDVKAFVNKLDFILSLVKVIY